MGIHLCNVHCDLCSHLQTLQRQLQSCPTHWQLWRLLLVCWQTTVQLSGHPVILCSTASGSSSRTTPHRTVLLCTTLHYFALHCTSWFCLLAWLVFTSTHSCRTIHFARCDPPSHIPHDCICQTLQHDTTRSVTTRSVTTRHGTARSVMARHVTETDTIFVTDRKVDRVPLWLICLDWLSLVCFARKVICIAHFIETMKVNIAPSFFSCQTECMRRPCLSALSYLAVWLAPREVWSFTTFVSFDLI